MSQTEITQKDFVALYKGIAAVKKEMGALIKDQKVAFGNTRYSYIDINQILNVMEPLCEKHGLLLMQPILSDGANSTCDLVRTTVFHIASGANVSSTKRLEAGGNAQAQGSLITYYRRYTLQALFGLQVEDDDGLAAVGKSRGAVVKAVRDISKNSAISTKKPISKDF